MEKSYGKNGELDQYGIESESLKRDTGAAQVYA